MVRPTMLQDDFMGDFYLGCPKCKTCISFPLVKKSFEHGPKKCTKCGEVFDWTEYMKAH